MKIINEVQELLKKHQYTPTLPVIIYGEKYEFTEVQMRALQCLAKRRADESEEAFEDFNCNVYISLSNELGEYELTNHAFTKDGHINGFFNQGFYDICSKFAIAISRAERHKCKIDI